MAGLTTGLAMTAGQAFAQTAVLDEIPVEGETPPPAPSARAPATTGDAQGQGTVTGEGEGEGEPTTVSVPNVLPASTGTGRLSGTVQDTPQIINVISQKQIQEQGVTTLEQALTNVPGVTVRIGEGGGGMNGDQFMIRGFEAKGDIYVDGLRDFGTYVRDSFAYEDIQVFKGPSSESFGVGTTGGAINNRTKQAHLGDKYRFEAAFGTDPLIRGGIDINKQIGDTTAIRAVIMGTDQDIADRDHTFNNRYGALVDFGTGIGTDTTWHLSYFYQHYDRMPDYGIPIITPTDADDIAAHGRLGQPATEFGLDRSNFYGRETDRDEGNVHALTSRYETEVNDWLTINNDTRLAYYDRDFATTVPSCAATCVSNFFDGLDGALTNGGGNPGYYQESWGFQNILSAKADFHTGFLRHEAIVGLDYLYQDDDRIRNSVYDSGTDTPNNASKPGQSLLDPSFDASGYYIARNHNDLKKSTSSNVALFASDRVWFNDQWSVLAGVRWDYFDVSYDTYSGDTPTWNHFDQQSDFFAPKASLIWEPTSDQTYYFSWARSANINGQFPTNNNATLGADEFEPEINESFELGAKLSLWDGRLGLTGAIFQIEKDNARYTVEGDTFISSEKHRVRGFELGVTGQITKAWSVAAAYAYLDSEVLQGRERSGAADPDLNGNEVPNAPQNAFSLWTTYNMSEHFQQLPGTWLVGGGVTYRDEVFTSSANTSIVPETFSLDLMTSYAWDKYRVALNAYNITDELNYSGVWGNRVVPSTGRTFTLTLGAEF